MDGNVIQFSKNPLGFGLSASLNLTNLLYTQPSQIAIGKVTKFGKIIFAFLCNLPLDKICGGGIMVNSAAPIRSRPARKLGTI